MSKAGRPKKGSLGLPKWFDIEKYRVVKSYGAGEWYQQLIFRALIDFYNSPDETNPVGPKWWALVKEDPNITLERIKKASAEEPSAGVAREKASRARDFTITSMTLSAASGSGVRPLTYGEIILASQLPDNESRITNAKNHFHLSERERETKWLASWDEPYPGNILDIGEIRYLRVDLMLPAPLLKRDFADYLKEQCKSVRFLQSPFFKTQDFSVWYNSGALPYLDLCQWEKETKETFRWSDFANALNDITDKSVGSEDACRKAAKSIAEKLLDSRTIRMLYFQAIKDKDGSRKKSGKLFVK
jgi:hypothetical protein